MPESILLMHNRAAGDITVMSAFVRDFALTHGDRYEIHVHTSCISLWEHNPYVAQTHKKLPRGMRKIKLDYGPYIRQANKVKLHFLTAFHRNFYEQTKIEVPVLYPKGDLHLSDWHKKNPPIDGRYWLIVTGGKSDFTTKIWSAVRHQQTVNILRQFGIRFVQEGATHSGHWHPPLAGVLNIIGRTNLRDLMWNIYHSDGVICPITSMMHMAAALDRPCVVIAGGREHYWWESYTNFALEEQFGPQCTPVKVPHRYLHTQGLLPCCKDRGCWKNKVTTKERDKHKSYCVKAVDDGYGQTIPECLKMIEVENVVHAVLSYYEAGVLNPPE